VSLSNGLPNHLVFVFCYLRLFYCWNPNTETCIFRQHVTEKTLYWPKKSLVVVATGLCFYLGWAVQGSPFWVEKPRQLVPKGSCPHLVINPVRSMGYGVWRVF
jgi:hypothetical protein